MNDKPGRPAIRHGPGRYEIRLKGHLEARRAGWFDGLSLRHETDGTTVIYGSVVDQAALHGLLTKVRHLGLPLVSVTQVDPHKPRDTNEANNSNLVRFAGLAGAHEGIVFAGIKPIHPPDVVDSVNTSTWATTTPLKTAMRMLLVRV